MPVYNGESYLMEAIDSILNQTYNNFEFIIVDDGSNDESRTIMQSYDDKRINIITQQNRGGAVARNSGLKIAKGTYIAMMDCDDICELNRFEIQCRYLDNNQDVIAVGSNANVIDINGNHVYTHLKKQYPIKSMLKSFNSPFIHSSVMFRRSVIDILGDYQDVPIGEDALFFIDMSKVGKLINLNKVLINYRLSPSSVSMNSYSIRKKLKNITKHYVNNGKLSNNDVKKLTELIEKQDTMGKYCSYYSYFARKYLWNNHSPTKARDNIKLALAIKPYNITNLILFILSYFPRNFIQSVYKTVKVNKY